MNPQALFLGFAWILLSCSLHSGTEEWELFDTDPTITGQLGTNRVSKWLVTHADPAQAGQRINQSLLGQALIEVIDRQNGLQLITADLSRGDFRLQRALAQILACYNFPEPEVHHFLESAARGVQETTLAATLHDALHRETTRQLLVRYLIDCPEEWPCCLEGVKSILQGRGKINPELFKAILEDSHQFNGSDLTSLVEKAQQGDLWSRCSVSESLQPILNQHGFLEQMLKSSPRTKDCLYYVVWDQVLNQIGHEGFLEREYHDRLLASHPLYQEFRSVLIEALQNDSDSFIRGYVSGSQIPDSRFSWVYQTIVRSHPEWSGIDPDYLLNSSNLRTRFREDLISQIRTNEEWSDYIMWELTRPAEAATISLRHSLPSSLGASEKICRELWSTYDLGLEFTQAVSDNGLFSGFPGGEEEFRRRMQTGTLWSGPLLEFGTGFGRLLSYSDLAWARIISGCRSNDNRRLRLLFEASFENDPATVAAWIETIRSNDSSLKSHFTDWLAATGKLKTKGAFDEWLQDVSAAISHQRIVGNPDVAAFKSWFLEFLRTDSGLQQVRERVAVESYSVPEPLREEMARSLQENPQELWKIYGMVTSMDAQDPVAVGLLAQFRAFALRSKLGQFLMEEVTAQNRAANDSMEAAWRKILGKDSSTLASIIATIQKGSSVSDLFGLVSLTLDQTIADPCLWQEVQPVLRPLFPEALDREQLLYQFQLRAFREGATEVTVICQLLDQPRIREEWRDKLLSAVNILGKGYIIADFVLHHAELMPEWNRSIADALISDPGSAQTMIEALLARRVGDETWDMEVGRLRYQIARIILENRELFETLIADKNRPLSVAAEKILASLAGLSPVKS